MPTEVELVTPDRKLFSGEADFVVMRTEGGDIMFLPNYTDFVGAFDVCVVRIAPVGEQAPGSAETASTSTSEVVSAVAGGFVHVSDNHVTILASVAELSDEIDVGRARAALEAAEAAEGEPATQVAPGQAGQAAPDRGEAEDEHLQSAAMTAILEPDLPEVRARRARARLEAAGALEGALTQGTSAH